MKTPEHTPWKRLTIVAVLAVSLTGVTAWADWDVQDGTKMHFPQLPDISTNGIDVSAMSPIMLADDFRCAESGIITGIHVWGSWRDDAYSDAPIFTLSLWSDNPANALNPFSTPSNLLWTAVFSASDYVNRLVADQANEWWWSPVEMDPSSDNQVWQYNFFVPDGAITQEQGKVYWLSVLAELGGIPDLFAFGWKTSPDHWNDAAVYRNLITPDWQPLIYPAWHPEVGGNIDLSFAITGHPVGGQVQIDYGDAPDPPYQSLIASTGASHIIGGPWLGNAQDQPDAEADAWQHPNALGDDFNGANDENGAAIPTMTRGVPTNFTLTVGATGVVDAWFDWNGNGDWEDPAERVLGQSFSAGIHSVPITPDPLSAVGETIARFRISSAGGLTPYGAASDGEVEDHPFQIADGFVSWCQIQWPTDTVWAVAGVLTTTTLNGRVYHPGITDAAGQGAGIIAQCGYGPDGSDPDGNPSWIWVNAAYSGDIGNDDEYGVQLAVPGPGRYDWAYRFSRGGVEWSYADNPPGSTDGYSPDDAGDLVVGDRGLCEKWVQPPDCENGIDLPTHGTWNPDTQEVVPSFVVADDWVCDGRPIVGIRWWGSYLGWTGTQPPRLPTEGRPIGFRVSWWTDIPRNPPGILYSRPAAAITNVTVFLADYGSGELIPGMAVERYYCTVSNKVTAPGFEHEFEYVVLLDEPWIEKEGTIYWLSIEALYDATALPGTGALQWGWKTSVRMDLIDDAVVWQAIDEPAGPVWEELTWPLYPWSHLWESYDTFVAVTNKGPSLNMAFDLLTDVCPRRTKKWAQPPDMIYGENMPTWAREGDPPEATPLRADDFISDGRRITDIHWWGSYLNYETAFRGPAPLPAGKPIGFYLSWHEDIPGAMGNVPGPLLRREFVPLDKCHEVFYGTVTQSWKGAYEHEYQYYVDLLNTNELDVQPWPEVSNVVYWLDVQAVFPQGWEPEQELEHDGWGWKSTPIENRWRNPSVYWDVTGGWAPATYPTNHFYPPSEFVDLAFELTTDEVGKNFGDPINITDVVVSGSNSVIVESVGDWGAGVQILQFTTNLLVSNSWMNLSTNPVPYSKPLTNTWPRGLTASNEFYRILQK